MSLHYRFRLYMTLSGVVQGSGNRLTAGSSSGGREEPETAGRTEADFKNRLKELVGKQRCGEELKNVFLLYVTAVFREVGLCICSSCENGNS